MYCYMLSICCSEWRIEDDLLGYMAGTYFSFIYVLLVAYLLDILVNTFGIWLGYILEYVVCELMR
jgi:hypothetical protein